MSELIFFATKVFLCSPNNVLKTICIHPWLYKNKLLFTNPGCWAKGWNFFAAESMEQARDNFSAPQNFFPC